MEISNEIILACKKQDRKHQKVLFDLLFPYLKNLCYRYINNKDELDDAVQVSFILIFKNIEQFKPELGRFKSWAAKIAINSSLKINRKHSYPLQDLDNITHIPVPAVALQNMNVENLLHLLDKIGEDYKTVFMMSVVDGFEYKEISDTLQISEESVRKRLSRARQKLRELIQLQEDTSVSLQKEKSHDK